MEAEEKAVYLDDVTVETFVAFTEWLYMRAVIPQPVVTYSGTERQRRHDWFEGGWNDDESNARDAFEDPDEDYGDCHSDGVDSFAENLLSFYIFADKYGIPELRTDLLDTLIQWCRYAEITPGIQCVPRAFQNLPSSSPFCRYLTDTNAASWYPETDPQSSLHPSLPREFLLKIISINSHRMSRYGTIDTLPLEHDPAGPCRYHEHKSKAERRACHRNYPRKRILRENLAKACAGSVSADNTDKESAKKKQKTTESLPEDVSLFSFYCTKFNKHHS